MRQAGLFGLSDQLKRLSDCGDPLETMDRMVDFEVFRPALEKALAYGDGAKDGRSGGDAQTCLDLVEGMRDEVVPRSWTDFRLG